MKHFISFVLVCFAFCTIPVVASTVQHKVVFDTKVVIDTTVAQDGNIYSVINLPDCSFSLTEGVPQLPVKTVNLIIPAGEEAVGVTHVKAGGTVISLNYPVLPVQKPIPTSVNFEGNEFVVPDKNIYSLDAGYPVISARILRTNHIRGNSVVVVEVSPVTCNPVKNQLEVFESIEITIQTKTSEKAFKSSPVKNKERFNNYLESLVDNKNDVANFSTVTQKLTEPDTNSVKSALATTGISIYCEYVIITSSSLSSYFNSFIAWKKQKGIDIELVTVESIYQNYTGDLISGINDNAGKIRQFLCDAYGNGLEYALLGGTSSVVPIRYGWGNNTSIDPVYEIPTDLYFSDFDGDWNIDADSRYGEPTNDDVDYGAEIFVGRLLCTTSSQIQNWTNKLLLYEKNPGNGSTAYLRKALYTQADQLQYYDQATDIANRFGSIFTTDEIFEEEYNGVPNYNSAASPQFPTGANVVNEINSGYGFVSWFNHGHPANVAVGTPGINGCINNDRKKVTRTNSYSGWCQHPESGDGLDNLSNSTKPFVLYTLACETTPFDTWESIAPSDNLGAQITNLSSKGGPIFLGNTRYGYVTSSWYLQQSFTNIIAGGTYQLGAAEAASKGTSGDHYVWLSHNLVGCPETEMWTDAPSQLSNVYAAKCGSNVIVNTNGITYCTVCVMSSNDNGATYWQVNNSSTTEKTFYNVPEPFVVTITKHNYIPKIIQSSEIETNLSTSITGPSIVCSNGGAFEIVDVPTGASIVWSKSSNLTQSTAQGTNPCTFSANGAGIGWISAQVITACANTTNLPQKAVWVGTPVISSISGPTYTPNYQWATYTAGLSSTLSAPDDYNWILNPLNGNSVYDYGSTADIAYYNSGTYQVVVQAHNTCNWGSYTVLGVEVYDSKRLSISPNPSSGETNLTIETISLEKTLDETVEWELEVFDNLLNLKEKKTKLKGISTEIQTQNWKEGVYIVRVKYMDEILTGKLVVKQ
jgi:hypothetical protein